MFLSSYLSTYLSIYLSIYLALGGLGRQVSWPNFFGAVDGALRSLGPQLDDLPVEATHSSEFKGIQRGHAWNTLDLIGGWPYASFMI